MQIKCEYCGSYINDTDQFCPSCGAANRNIHRAAEGVPKTIEELKQYAAYNKLPLEQMRFYIGVDFKEPRAFGIYEDHGTFYVYKNKSDGTRVIRYRGTDEAYAVNELYQKMRSEVIARKQGISNRSATPSDTKKSAFSSLLRPLIFFMIAIIATGVLRGCLSFALNGFSNSYSGSGSGYYSDSPSYSSGYYKYNNDLYYSNGYSWYSYQNNDWNPVTPDKDLTDNYRDYFESYSYSDSYGAEDFNDSDYYSNSNSYSNDSYDDSYDDSRWDSSWDNDDSWDSYDSWDSGGTDWDSDW